MTGPFAPGSHATPLAGPRSVALASPPNYQVIQIPEGDAGTAETIAYMLRAIRGESPFPPPSRHVRELAENILARAGWPQSTRERIVAIYGWVRDRVIVPQVRDRAEVEEIRSPDYILNRIAELGRIPYDCDDTAILLGALLRSIGIKIKLNVISTYASESDDFSHIYLEAYMRPGWLPLDPILGREAGWEAPDRSRVAEVPV